MSKGKLAGLTHNGWHEHSQDGQEDRSGASRFAVGCGGGVGQGARGYQKRERAA